MNKAKGIKRKVVEQDITHNHYYQCLFNKQIFNTKMRKIESKEHRLSTVEITKTVLQPLDDKRVLCDNGIDSLALWTLQII